MSAVKDYREKPDCNEKQALFCKHYVVNGGDGFKAYMDAGYTPKTKASARVAAFNLLKKPKIKKEIARIVSEAANRVDTKAIRKSPLEKQLDISAERTISELGRIAFSDPSDIVDKNNNLIPIHEIPEDARRAIASVKVRRVMEGEEPVQYVEYKFWDKPKSLSKIGEYFGLWESSKGKGDTTNINITGMSDEQGLGILFDLAERVRQRRSQQISDQRGTGIILENQMPVRSETVPS